MQYFFKYPTYEYEPVRYVVNPARCVQAFLCLGCFALSIYMVVELSILHVSFKVILAVTAAAFATITIVDIISTSHYDPIFWNNWILFAISGALFFFLSIGILFAVSTGLLPILIIGEVIYGVTGIMFLLDALYLINGIRRRQAEVSPLPPDYYQKKEEPEEEPTLIEERKRSISESHYVATTPTAKSSGLISSEERQESFHERYETAAAKPPSYRGSAAKRSTTSYGGTFPMAKDAAPLPSPEPLYKEDSKLKQQQSSRTFHTTRRKASPSSSQIITSDSQIVEPVSDRDAPRIYPGPDGRMHLADGTPLEALRNEAGEVSCYQSPDGVLYTRDGIPIAAVVPPQCRTSCQELKSPGTSDSLADRARSNASTTQILSSDSQVLETVSREKSKIYRGSDGRTYLTDGTPLEALRNDEGDLLFYQSPDGVLYTRVGIPIAAAAPPVRRELQSLRESYGSERRAPQGSQKASPAARRICSVCAPDQRSPKQGVMVEETVTTTERSASGHRIQQTVVRTTSGHRGVEPAATHGDHRSDFRGDRAVRRSVERAITEKKERSAERPRDLSATRCVERSCEQGQGGADTPRTHREVHQTSVERRKVDQSGTSLRTIRSSEHVEKEYRGATQPPCSQCSMTPMKKSDTIEKEHRSKVQPESCQIPSSASRTVAVSTRMVPKMCTSKERSHSAPGNPEGVQKESFKRTVKSAETNQQAGYSEAVNVAVAYQYQQQQPAVVYHQYVQKPCHCGKMHYQTTSTVHGNVVATSCPFYATQQPAKQPQQTPCTPTTPCGRPECECCRRKQLVSFPSCSKIDSSDRKVSQQPREPQVEVPPQPLQTISECECETDPSSTWEQDRLMETSSEVSSIPQTSSENVRASSDGTSCGKKSPEGRCKSYKTTDTEQVQTSETRMIRARDLQKINPNNLPGSADV